MQGVEVQVDERRPAGSVLTGTDTAGEFRCSGCGYGAVVQRVLPPCPMCGGTVWESRPPRFPG